MTRTGKRERRVAKAELEARWAAFDHLVGTHLSWHKAGRGRWELATRSGEVWASVRSGQLFIDDENYEERSVGAHRLDGDWSGIIDKTVWVVDSSDDPVLRFEGRHFERRAYTKVILRDQSMLRFPVTGRWNKAFMSAVDESGNTLIHYRLGPPTHGLPIVSDSLRRIEAVVTPAAHRIPEIPLIVAATPNLLFGYFANSEGGGAS